MYLGVTSSLCTVSSGDLSLLGLFHTSPTTDTSSAVLPAGLSLTGLVRSQSDSAKLRQEDHRFKFTLGNLAT